MADFRLRHGRGRSAFRSRGRKAPGRRLFQPLQAGVQGREVSAEAFVAELQQAQLRLGAEGAAVAEAGQGLPQNLRHVKQAAARSIRTQGREGLFLIQSRQQSRAALRGRVQDQQVPAQVRQLPQQSGDVLAVPVELVQQQQGFPGVPLQKQFHEPGGLHSPCQAQQVQNSRSAQGPLKAAALVQQAQRVTHGAARHPGQNIRPVRGQVDLLLPGDVAKLTGDVPGQDTLEGIALAAGEDGGRDLMQLRGSQDEHQMLRRLLQDFKQGVKGGGGEHMHLIDDIHTLFQHRGGIHRLLPKGPDAVHAVVAGGV